MLIPPLSTPSFRELVQAPPRLTLHVQSGRETNWYHRSTTTIAHTVCHVVRPPDTMLAGLRRLRPRSATQVGVSQARCFSSIPVIDVSPLTQPFSSTERQQQAAVALHEAARRVGFFYAANTGVPEQLCKDILLHARRWFDLPVS